MDDLKVEIIARAAHEINRIYCSALGDDSQSDWDSAPEWQRQSAINGVRFHLSNENVTPEQSHECWLREKLAAGWTYGLVKDADKLEHPCCVEYDELPLAQRAKDSLFSAVVTGLSDI
jgi:hypothetical protein